jgi:mRNA-degrading endonuclease RelE of RelBE toxin-antitoxin system
MVEVTFLENFKRVFMKIKDNTFKKKLKTQIRKIKENPEIGKPMRNVRKGTRELYVKPYRLSYMYLPDKKLVYILDLYHKKFQ